MSGLKELFGWLGTLNLLWWQAFIFLIFIGVVILILNWEKTKNFFKIFKFDKKRISCENCLQILMGFKDHIDNKLKEYVAEYKLIEDSILKNQMNYAEQKIIDIETIFLSYYSSILNEKAEDIDNKTEVIQYRMFWGLTKDTLYLILKDNIRKTFKENGFEDLTGNDFSSYVKAKSHSLHSLIRQQIVNLYPGSYANMLVSMDDILQKIESFKGDFEDIIFEIYEKAKFIKCKSKEDLIVLKKEKEDYINKINAKIIKFMNGEKE